MNNTTLYDMAALLESLNLQAAELVKDSTTLLKSCRESNGNTVTYRMQSCAETICDTIVTLQHLKEELIQAVTP